MDTEIARRCTATNRDGNRCGRAPIPGGTVCPNHGGKIPSTIAAAHLNLLKGRDLSIDALIRALQSHGPPCDHCGRSDGDRDPVVIRAAQIVLDRTGFGPTVTLVTPTLPKPVTWMEWATTEQLLTVNAIIEDAKRRMESGEPKPSHSAPSAEGNVVDGEVADAPIPGAEVS